VRLLAYCDGARRGEPGSFAKEASTVGKWIGVTIVAVVVALCVACAQPPIRPTPGIGDQIDRDAGIDGTAGARAL
jgi:hypothetical protein